MQVVGSLSILGARNHKGGLGRPFQGNDAFLLNSFKNLLGLDIDDVNANKVYNGKQLAIAL